MTSTPSSASRSAPASASGMSMLDRAVIVTSSVPDASSSSVTTSVMWCTPFGNMCSKTIDSLITIESSSHSYSTISPSGSAEPDASSMTAVPMSTA